jgi:hypothetical protein
MKIRYTGDNLIISKTMKLVERYRKDEFNRHKRELLKEIKKNKGVCEKIDTITAYNFINNTSFTENDLERKK